MPEPGGVLTREQVEHYVQVAALAPRRKNSAAVAALARSHEQLREIVRAYLIAVGRAPGNRDEEEVRLATAALVHAAALSAGEETP